MKQVDYQSLFLILVISFIEGGVVMMVEVSGAKMIAPFYGTSLYVWASVLSVTLLGLASGYFVGGQLAAKKKIHGVVLLILSAGSFLVAAMPDLATTIIPIWQKMPLSTASLLSAVSIMLLPLVCMGMVSPLLIQLLSVQLDNSGKAAGIVYAVSTVGGIAMTLTTGFYLLPQKGITVTTSIAAGLLLVCIGVFALFIKRTIS